MTAGVLFIGLDACDVVVAEEFARHGDMPVLAGLLDSAAVQPTMGPLGFLVGGTWPTIFTGMSPSHHQFLCSGQIQGGTYGSRWLEPMTDPEPIWQPVSRRGGRVAVLDAPHAAVQELNGVQLVEYGCHDRHAGTKSYPESFLGEVVERYGRHLGMLDEIPFHHAAPCDHVHRSGLHRTVDEDRALRETLIAGHERKAAIARDLLEREHWELMFAVFGESHCAGHQFWKYHDPTHVWHDPAAAQVLGNPMRDVYRAMDATIGELIERAGADAAVYVLLSHGMASHYDGTCLVEPVLWRLDEYASGLDARGRFTSALDAATTLVPRSLRPRALQSFVRGRRRLQARTGPIGTDGRSVDIPEWVGQRRWWMQPNDSRYASIRLNLEGREPNGRIAARRKRDVEEWLAVRFYELVNTETGGPAVDHVHFVDDHYERVPGDPLGDLIVDWNRAAPIDTVWSPATGVVTAPYLEWRSGDHERHGVLLVRAPGVEPGRRPVPISTVHVGPTVAASLRLDTGAFDGVPRADLVPPAAGTVRRSAPVPEPNLSTRVPAPRARRRYDIAKFDVRLDRWTEQYAVGLSRSLHVDHVRIGDEEAARRQLEQSVVTLRGRVSDLERLAAITELSAWLRQTEVPERLLVSVVMPTHNRAELLARAVDSVMRQSYGNWELVVVDDASSDETPAVLAKLADNEPRVRAFRFDEQRGSSRARNHALDRAVGDVICYLDDDNRFDTDWLRTIAWAFDEYPETTVCYGARVIDDEVRHHGFDGRSLPFVQFNAWDRDEALKANIVDQNTIAHRPSPVRFDESIHHMTDWDLLLQLTDDCDPLELPAIAALYHSDAPMRLNHDFQDKEFERSLVDYIVGRARVRRRQCGSDLRPSIARADAGAPSGPADLRLGEGSVAQ